MKYKKLIRRTTTFAICLTAFINEGLAQKPTSVYPKSTNTQTPVKNENEKQWKLTSKIEDEENVQSRLHGVSLGIHAGINVNTHSTNFNSLSGVPNCCTSYNTGLQGNGIAAGIVVDLPITELLGVQVKGTYSDLSGETTIREFIGQKWIDNKPVPVNVNHNLISDIKVISIDPILNIRPFKYPLDFNVGLSFGNVITHNAIQSEVIATPNFLFTDTTSSRNNYSGEIPNANNFFSAGILGVGYEIMLSENLFIQPEIQYSLPFTNVANGLDWNAASLRFGSALKFSFGGISPLDFDGDGITNEEESRYGTNPKDIDSDNDGLSDGDEIKKYYTNPRNPDTDNDGLIDGKEVNFFGTMPKNADTDSDVLFDGDEINIFKTDPKSADTDNDGLDDGKEIRTYLTDPLNPDTDGDGLTDGQEVTRKTDPKKVDTDGDGLEDGREVSIFGTDPTKVDTDGDKLSDGQEVNTFKSDPLKKDTDGDGVIDGDDLCPLIVGTIANQGCVNKPVTEKEINPLDKKGSRLSFNEIYFLVNSDKFDMERQGTINDLTKLAEFLKQCDQQKVVIEGHTSKDGKAEQNQSLSEMRAESVRRWLIDQGIENTKIQGIIGYGSRRPAVSEPDPKSASTKSMDKVKLDNIRKKNRRITVQVIKGCD
jgi:outer membrane protein OmpA-like peptidoglycan-associated protein